MPERLAVVAGGQPARDPDAGGQLGRAQCVTGSHGGG
jgi:hypothetical protein